LTLPPVPTNAPVMAGVVHKNRRNCSGIRSTSRSSPGPSVTAVSPGLSQNGTTTSPRAACAIERVNPHQPAAGSGGGWVTGGEITPETRHR